MKKTKEKVAIATTPQWEIKDRRYLLKDGLSPLSFMMKSKGLFYFDEEKGYEREVAYAENQKTPFVDEFKGQARLAHIIFRDGELVVPKNKVTLQRFLSIYHPEKDTTYEEFNPVKEATEDLVDIEMEIKALNAAKDLDIDHAEAILRVEIGSEVANMSSKEIKRDILIMAKSNPVLFLELVADDNVELRNFGIKAVEANIISLSSDNRNFLWASNQRKIMTVPYDEHPYSALAAFFKTDEGLEIYKNIEKRLK
tara:strand:+ start:165 stop:926 length:762 start_codon:yes stop_codon:yes gene_type:complete